MFDTLPKAMLVDLDDTILAFSITAGTGWARICDRYAERTAGVSAEALCEAILGARTWFWSDATRHQAGRRDLGLARREVVARALRSLGVDAAGLSEEIADAYTKERDALIYPLPGAIEALHHFRDRGVRLALVTNGTSADQRRKIVRFALAPLFDCIVIEGELGVGKPDERIYRYALARLGSAPEEAWMIGDNLEWEVAAPQRLGMIGVWVDVTGEGLPDGCSIRPDRIIRALADLV